MIKSHHDFMNRAVLLSQQGMAKNEGGPFGAVIVQNGAIIAEGNNQVTSTPDPTAHAEIVAIRRACQRLARFELKGCTLYTSCEPCPMCLGAIYWARFDAVYYANNRLDAANIGFDDSFIYDEIEKPLGARQISFIEMRSAVATAVFTNWIEKADRTEY